MTILPMESRFFGPKIGLARRDERQSFPSHNIRVVLVDCNDDFRENAAAALADFGFEVTTLDCGAALVEQFEGALDADIILLDWKLQQDAGIELIPKLRRRGINIPVVFLTGIVAPSAESIALDMGALDFVHKSRGIEILAKRIRLIFEAGARPLRSQNERFLRCGELVLRVDASRANWNGTDVQLTVTEFKIVHLLAVRAEEFVSYRAIYDCVHSVGFCAGSGEDGFRTNVRSSMKRIRNKFKAIDPGFAEIENFSAFGYRWRVKP
jgi:two-component system, OmpR family, response regulator ChvI